MSSTITVKNLPANIRVPLLKRGYVDSDSLTPREAMAQWTAWHIGSALWGYDIIDGYEALNVLADAAKPEA